MFHTKQFPDSYTGKQLLTASEAANLCHLRIRLKKSRGGTQVASLKTDLIKWKIKCFYGTFDYKMRALKPLSNIIIEGLSYVREYKFCTVSGMS